MRKESSRAFPRPEVCLFHSLILGVTQHECAFWCSFTKEQIIYKTGFPAEQPRKDKVYFSEEVATNFRNTGEKIEQMGRGGPGMS